LFKLSQGIANHQETVSTLYRITVLPIHKSNASFKPHIIHKSQSTCCSEVCRYQLNRNEGEAQNVIFPTGFFSSPKEQDDATKSSGLKKKSTTLSELVNVNVMHKDVMKHTAHLFSHKASLIPIHTSC
jgi:hypothetical protein